MTDQIDIAHLRSWIGREEEATDVVGAELVRRFAATLDLEPASAGPGSPAPALIHLCLAPPVVPTCATGPDGHPARGGFLPPVPLPRRMWAGGAFTFHRDIRVGERVLRRSRIGEVAVKEGRTGLLCFVTVEHRISVEGELVVTERQDIVYRDAGGAPSAVPEPAPAGEVRKHVAPTPLLLFRYSALTFNGHRIHYDHPYATGVEGYPGLVVHGPMQATMLLHHAAAIGGRTPSRFSFRSLSPLFDDADFTLNAVEDGEGIRLWTAREGGPVAMSAQAWWQA
ncbi:FAS1-like dehydratase domain-containing protein [Aureimonas populi]|uniref:MaoC family dehydratase N-terminal domain-containing protein n=1 Tax=Aureimonas populi TaxID=1701758 RepID=A0ABW5CLL5_9HYPH|nr:MaoC family dehydratase N-terminal domain-containing protein [Aureimonas populi]